MKAIKIFCTITLAILLTGYNFSCSPGGDKSGIKTKPVTSADKTALNGATIKNDIDLEVTGVKLKEAYLLDANKELLKENVTRLNEKIYVVIRMDTGWVKEKGKSYIGASERISTESGNVIVDAEDVFKDYEVTGISAEDAGVISLSAVITQADTGVEDFTVRFRVWDKKGNGEVKGNYKFKIKK